MSIKGQRYEQHMNKFTVRQRDNPNEYARQYYWIVLRGLKEAPPKQIRRKMRRRKK